MNTIHEIKYAMSSAILHPKYDAVKLEFHRLLSIMGNVDGDEVISLVLVAYGNVTTPDGDWWQP